MADTVIEGCAAHTTDSQTAESEVVKLKEEILGEVSQIPEAVAKQLVPLKREITNRQHIDFVTLAANLRAKNYHLPELDPVYVARSTGYLTGTSVATESVAAGSAILELYKYAQNLPLEKHRDC